MPNNIKLKENKNHITLAVGIPHGVQMNLKNNNIRRGSKSTNFNFLQQCFPIFLLWQTINTLLCWFDDPPR